MLKKIITILLVFQLISLEVILPIMHHDVMEFTIGWEIDLEENLEKEESKHEVIVSLDRGIDKIDFEVFSRSDFSVSHLRSLWINKVIDPPPKRVV